MSEEVTEAKPRRKAAAPKGPAVETPKPKAEIYAKARYNHKPTDGDLAGLTPRLLQPLALQAQTHGRTLADGTITITVTQEPDGNWDVFSTLELKNL
jgi:hypothetical protein